MARQFAMRIDLQKKIIKFEQFCNSRESPRTCDSHFLVPRSALRKEGVQFRSPGHFGPSKVGMVLPFIGPNRTWHDDNVREVSLERHGNEAWKVACPFHNGLESAEVNSQSSTRSGQEKCNVIGSTHSCITRLALQVSPPELLHMGGHHHNYHGGGKRLKNRSSNACALLLLFSVPCFSSLWAETTCFSVKSDNALDLVESRTPTKRELRPPSHSPLQTPSWPLPPPPTSSDKTPPSSIFNRGRGHLLGRLPFPCPDSKKKLIQ